MRRVVVTGWMIGLALCSTSRASAQDMLTFSLDEVAGAANDEAGAQVAHERTIEQALGELRWGMSQAQVVALLKARVRAEYDESVKNERDILRQDALYQDANARYRRFKSNFISFDGRKTGWDVSPVADEFRHGSREAMLFVDVPAARDLYFFIDGRLWKWYRELKSDAQEGSSYDQVAEVLRGQLGRARSQSERRTDAGDALPGLTWQDAKTRVTLIRRGSDTCLVFEDKGTLDRLALLRKDALPREPKPNGALEQVLMTASEREAWRARQDRPRTAPTSKRPR